MMRSHSAGSLSRRGFHTVVAGALAKTLTPRPARAASEPPAGRYFDIHTHVGRTWNDKDPLSAEALLRWMDASQIAQAAVLPLISPESSGYPITPDSVLTATAPYRDRLIPFCSVDPRTSYRGGHRGLVAMLRDYVQRGAKGFGEHKTGVPIDNPRNLALYAACDEVRLPVLFHMDNLRNMDQPGLPGLEKVLKTFPKVNFIGHGPGWWASIGPISQQSELEKYPRGPIAPGGAIDRLMDKYPNIFGDLSAGSGAGAISRDPEFGRQFLIRRADRLLFGTDFLAPGQDVPQLDLYAKVDLPAEVQQKVFLGNARRLLDLN
jgi:hypothetical protein